MRIKGLWKYVEDNHLNKHTLKNCAVVIDGQNMFYNKYKESKLPYAFGSESDRYAHYLKNYIKMFVAANVKCYILFKGGHEDIDVKFKRLDDKNHLQGESFVVGKNNADIILPVFMKSVYKEVLDELSIDYVICEFESKRECIAYAQKHTYPIISFDVEFCFSGVPYIPSSTLKFNETDKSISCGIFSFDIFLNFYSGLNVDKLTMFIVLTDQNIFEENFFISFLKYAKIPLSNYFRISALLKYLSNNSKDRALREISKFLKFQDKRKFIKAAEKTKLLINEKIAGGYPPQYLDNGSSLPVSKFDPDWFVKGVASKFIAIPYINMYRSNVVLGSGAIAYNKYSDPLLFSIDIIQYAYDLLTDYKNEGLEIISQQSWLLPNTRGDTNNSNARSIKKPRYKAVDSVFENGWDQIRSIGLVEHFLKEKLIGIDLQQIEKIPDDARLIAVALTYFVKRRTNCLLILVPSVLLCYVMLNVVHNKNKSNDDGECDNDINRNDSEADYKLAKDKLNEFFELTNDEASKIFDRKRLHPFVEFQHCLEELNFLNKLCGSPYQGTTYSKTFNATFVYKVMYTIEHEYQNNGLDFVNDKLKLATTVLCYFINLFALFEKILKSNRAMTWRSR